MERLTKVLQSRRETHRQSDRYRETETDTDRQIQTEREAVISLKTE